MAALPTDPMDFLKSMMGKTNVPIPGMLMPTMDIGELDKKISDLKTVELWLQTNLSMLQLTIQGLEVQRATLSTLKTITGSPPDEANKSAWPWNLMQQATETVSKAAAATAGAAAPKKRARPAAKPKGK